VTHDQIEAMTLADRIVLMRDGRIEQLGSPLHLFEQPATLFVAGFLGSPKMSFLRGRVAQGNVVIGGGVALPLPRGRGAPDGAEVILGVRPEHAARAAGERPAPGNHRVSAAIEIVQPTGSRSYATFDLGGQPLLAELQAHDVSQPGETIAIDLNLDRASLFDPGSGRAI
jgi:multiple sugar transport system ATP-binding protein